MTGIIKKQLILASLILLVGLFFTQKANAATLSNASDTLSTSRPSAAAPLAANQAANATQVQVVSLPGTLNNSDQWLASDSAVLFADTGQSFSAGNIVASSSASGYPTANQRIVFFTAAISTAHHSGTTMITPVTAMHTIKFTTNTSVPSGGKIVITFPGTLNTASPSATGFTFNNEAASPTDTTCYDVTGAQACAGSVAYANGVFTFTTGVAIATAHQVIINLGCTSQSSGICTVGAPRIINPVKGATANGTADSWKISVKTQDNSGSPVDLDSVRILAATVEAVQVQGTVEPYITFTIAGVNNNTSACSDTTNPGAGLDATATFVNLGTLSTAINISAQTLTVNTNGAGGYTITSTSSGRFINPGSGFYIADANGGNGLTAVDTPAPGFLTGATPAFGIHPCAAGSTSIPTVLGTWGSGATGGGAGAKYSNPWNTGTNTYYANVSSFNGPATNSTTTVEYAATVSNTTPAGTYFNYFTYVATPIF